MVRNRQLTEQKLVEAVGVVLEAEGLGGLNASAIAARAGVDKALIYKYFGNLETLLRRYGEGADLWWTAEELLEGVAETGIKLNRSIIFSLVLVRFLKSLRRRPAARAILAGEVIQNNVLVDILAAKRERETKRLFGALTTLFGGPLSADEIVGLTSYMHAITYATLLGRGGGRTVFGIDLGTGELAWAKLEAAIMTGAKAQFTGWRTKSAPA